MLTNIVVRLTPSLLWAGTNSTIYDERAEVADAARDNLGRAVGTALDNAFPAATWALEWDNLFGKPFVTATVYGKEDFGVADLVAHLVRGVILEWRGIYAR